MKSSLRGVSAIALIAAALSAGCGKSPTEIYCANGAKCGLFEKGTTEAQCVATGEKTASALHNDPDCKEVAEKFDAVRECQATLSCEDLKDPEAEADKCKQQVDELHAAQSTAAKTCMQ